MEGRYVMSLQATSSGCSHAATLITPRHPYYAKSGFEFSDVRKQYDMESALAGLLRLRPCRVTNEGQEMMVPQFASTNEIDLGPQYQVPDPEKGPLEKRVGRTFIDALFSDEISLEDMQYWFTTPPGGWNNEHKKVEKAEEVPFEWWNAAHPGPGRVKLEDLQEGMEFTGTVNKVLMLHGVVIDIGAEFDGLIPVRNDYHAWKPLRGEFQLDSEVKVRIHQIYPGSACRFPVQLELLEPAHLIQYVVPPEEWWGPSYDLRDCSTVEAMCEATGQDVTYGRPFEINSLLSGQNDPEATDVLAGMESLMLSNGVMAAWPENLDGPRDEINQSYISDDIDLDSLAARLY